MARQWVYPLSVQGRFQRIHRITGFVLQAVLFVTPWIPVDGRPAVQIDVPARRIVAFGGVYTASDAIFLVLSLLVAVFSLFLVTALWGRLWCGYACPQTVFLEEWVRPIERLVEGDRSARMRLALASWTPASVARRVAKLALFAAVAGLVAMAAVSWFVGPVPLWTGAASASAYGVVGVLGAVLFADFAWFREQFCNYLCPYARFQGALSDEGSLAVHYDAAHGEPRRGGGACIDCKKCVAVCPQGIDIRDGFQLECIACGRCVDACEGVMEKRDAPSLVVYAPLRKRPLIRPRTVAYGALLTGLATAFVTLLAMHDGIDASIARAPGTLFQTDPDGWTRNVYLLEVVNTSLDAAEAVVQAEGLPADAQVTAPAVRLEPAASVTVPVVVRVRTPGAPITRYSFTVATRTARVHLPATFAAAGG